MKFFFFLKFKMRSWVTNESAQSALAFFFLSLSEKATDDWAIGWLELFLARFRLLLHLIQVKV